MRFAGTQLSNFMGDTTDFLRYCRYFVKWAQDGASSGNARRRYGC